MRGRDCLPFFERLKERANVVVFAMKFLSFKMVDDSHGPYVLSRRRTADTVEDLENAE
jgi:hypothetical protein